MFRRIALALSALALLAIPTTVAAAGPGGLPLPASHTTTPKATGRTTTPAKKPSYKPTPSPTKTSVKPTPPPVTCPPPPKHHKGRPCYPPKRVTVTISQPNPVVGQKSLVVVRHAKPRAMAKLRVITAGSASPNIRIAGVWESAGKAVGADGTVEFPVVISAPGEFTIDVLVDDAVVSEQTLTALDDSAAVVPTAALLGGLDPLRLGLIGGGAAIVVAGIVVFLVRRRGGAHAI